MPELKGKTVPIVPRVPYVPISPPEWFEENGLENPRKGGHGPEPGPAMTPSIHVKDGKAEIVKRELVYGGDVSDDSAEDLRIVSYDGLTGGVYVEGAASDYTVTGASISLSSDGQGLGEQSAGAGVSNHGRLTLRNCLIDVTGAARTATSASGGSVLKVYDSAIISHGAPFGADAPETGKTYAGPPAPLEIQGNNRTHCTILNSYSYFYNSLISCDGWACLSTDASNGYVYLEANGCRVIANKSGYGAYADWGCHDVFNDCSFNVASQGAIMAGECSVKWNRSTVNCGTYLAMVHCVMGRHTEVGELYVTDCKVKTGSNAIEVHGQNLVAVLKNSVIDAKGCLYHARKNDDPNATRVNGRPTPGDELRLIDMSANGDILHEDPERDCRVYLASACLSGAVRNAYISMDQGSRWYATGDSDVVLGSDLSTEQLDAPEGVTITMKAAEGQGEYTLLSGGKLVVTD